MIYTSKTTEKNAAMQVAALMSAAARTAPKACGVDAIETLVLDGEEKDKVSAVMREIGRELDQSFYIRDADGVDASHLVVLIGVNPRPRMLNCKLCGVEDCRTAHKSKISCALAVNDLGIAVGSAAATAMDCRMDNRILFSAGMAARRLGLFPDKVSVCFGIPLAITGKNVFFDRPADD